MLSEMFIIFLYYSSPFFLYLLICRGGDGQAKKTQYDVTFSPILKIFRLPFYFLYTRSCGSNWLLLLRVVRRPWNNSQIFYHLFSNCLKRKDDLVNVVTKIKKVIESLLEYPTPYACSTSNVTLRLNNNIA